MLQGEIWAVMDRDEALLTAGDVLIQRGTAHGWENRSDRMARIAFVLIDGTRGGVEVVADGDRRRDRVAEDEFRGSAAPRPSAAAGRRHRAG
ncbi:hypothetical protein AB5I41_15985 [Sphingomonas sp. MMS24-JH45]